MILAKQFNMGMNSMETNPENSGINQPWEISILDIYDLEIPIKVFMYFFLSGYLRKEKV